MSILNGLLNILWQRCDESAVTSIILDFYTYPFDVMPTELKA